jgi:hypothetical protein
MQTYLYTIDLHLATPVLSQLSGARAYGLDTTALRGWLRGRARRILAMILEAQNQSPAKAEDWVKTLFGSEEKRGLLNFCDAVSDKVATAHPQMFNAIDRFTGGVADNKLYQARAVAECGTLRGEVWLETDKLQVEHKGLLLLLARDLLEGDLVLGWGKGRGYGVFDCELRINNADFAAWRKQRDGECDVWLKALRGIEQA